jgi:uncharacterized protein (TIGR01244 family)
MKKTTTWILILAVLSLLSSAALAQSQPRPVKSPPRPDYLQMVYPAAPNLFIGPQPFYPDLQRLKQAGITKVINFRTPQEMKELRFDEASELKKMGIDYVLIPIGGKEFPRSPRQTQALAEALKGENGKVLMHCRSGHRASEAYIAWLVNEKGVPINDALDQARAFGWWPPGVENLLGKKMKVTLEEQPVTAKTPAQPDHK